jgi:oxygen-independent coproporphyrinogen-3 oxidase
MADTSTAGIGLYIHVPFCPAKCGYCDFYSVPVASSDTSALVDRLLTELRLRVGLDTAVGTIFVGGGTPTVLPSGDLGRLLRPLSAVARHPTCREFTVEANPATVDGEKADLLAAAGASRLSVGAQSFQADELRTLDRVHSPGDVAPAVTTARAAGIRGVNLDLIFGIPGQTLRTWRDSLDRAMDLEPDHLALYGLTYEPGTPLARSRDQGQVTPCPEELEAEMYLEAVARVKRRGFDQYEISNFARPGQRCLHNLAYWTGQPYLGVGPSAVGCIDGQRYRNVPDVDEYARMIDRDGHAVAEAEPVAGKRLAAEMIMLQLRLVEGLDSTAFEQQTGLCPSRTFASVINRHERAGLLRAGAEHIALTNQGRLFADTIIADFMAELDNP